MANSGLTYPLRCNIPIDLLPIQLLIYKWLKNNANVHFMYNAHTLMMYSYDFTDALYGHKAQRKIILISHNMDIGTEVDALVTIFVR